jgi:plasmid stability protein
VKQITVRSIPEDLQREIQARALARGESLNKSVIRLLRQAVGLDRAEKKKRDLSALVGKWGASEAAEFERNMRAFETIDEDLWK